LVISQIPPPVHGSTLMTEVFLDVLSGMGADWRLVDRRFSRSAGEIGRMSIRKIAAAASLVVRLATYLLRDRPRAVVFFTTTRSFSFFIDCVLSELTRLSSVPTVQYVHALGFRQLAARGRLRAHLVRRLLTSASEIVVLSETLKADIQPFYDGRIRVIENVLPEEPPEWVHRAPMEARNEVLFLSNLVAGKGYEDFLEIAFACLESGADATFVLAGHSSPEVAGTIEREIQARGLTSSITYLGAVSGDQKWEVLARARALVFPSYSEALPLVQIEALASGVPILGYRAGALADRIAASGAGQIVEVGDRPGLARAVQDVLGDLSRAVSMSRSARSLYRVNFNPSNYAKDWRDLMARHLG
jgi:glycosyltransferase involved in cell wall biosynthesis